MGSLRGNKLIVSPLATGGNAGRWQRAARGQAAAGERPVEGRLEARQQTAGPNAMLECGRGYLFALPRKFAACQAVIFEGFSTEATIGVGSPAGFAHTRPSL